MAGPGNGEASPLPSPRSLRPVMLYKDTALSHRNGPTAWLPLRPWCGRGSWAHWPRVTRLVGGSPRALWGLPASKPHALTPSSLPRRNSRHLQCRWPLPLSCSQSMSGLPQGGLSAPGSIHRCPGAGLRQPWPWAELPPLWALPYLPPTHPEASGLCHPGGGDSHVCYSQKDVVPKVSEPSCLQKATQQHC